MQCITGITREFSLLKQTITKYFKDLPMNLFEPITFRNVTLRNRIAVSPMCQYSSDDGFANDWHLVHLGSRAIGGAGLVFTEASAVTAEGRISPQDLGIYDDKHIEFLSRITQFIRDHGAIAGMQLAHAGRKSSTARPWDGGDPVGPELGGWAPVAGPSPIPFSDAYQTPHELMVSEIATITESFGAAAGRAKDAGFQVIEIHAAHGYLIHEFLSPISNHRTDEYGGSFANRTRFLREVVRAAREHWPEELPIFVRISSTEWVPDGWGIEESVELASVLKSLGVDLVDCSSGGNVPKAPIPLGPGYQTAFAERIRRESNIATGAVGMITSPVQADHIIRTGQADMVLLAREMLRDPYWPNRASRELTQKSLLPQQYGRA
jgi:2,4-dienoyl-CoA reductase-like NADH-dependent reductase (Old Yellow Enzyme family)